MSTISTFIAEHKISPCSNGWPKPARLPAWTSRRTTSQRNCRSNNLTTFRRCAIGRMALFSHDLESGPKRFFCATREAGHVRALLIPRAVQTSPGYSAATTRSRRSFSRAQAGGGVAWASWSVTTDRNRHMTRERTRARIGFILDRVSAATLHLESRTVQ
jgi:hypothetical protein